MVSLMMVVAAAVTMAAVLHTVAKYLTYSDEVAQAMVLWQAAPMVNLTRATDPVTPPPEADLRTVEDVLLARSTRAGCCDRHVDRKPCPCLLSAFARAAALADNSPRCSVCYNPNCDNPNGKH